MYDTHMSTPANTAKLGTAHSNIQTAQEARPWLGANLQCISQHIYRVSTVTHYASQA